MTTSEAEKEEEKKNEVFGFINQFISLLISFAEFIHMQCWLKTPYITSPNPTQDTE